MRVKWASSGEYHSCWPPSVILGGPFSRIRGSVDELGYLALNPKKIECFLTFFASTLFRHFRTLWAMQLNKPGLELLQSRGCLSGEIKVMTQTSKRKATETVRGYKSSK